MPYLKTIALTDDEITGIKIRNEAFPTDLDQYKNLYTIEFDNFHYENLGNALAELRHFENITKCKISYRGKYKNLYDIPEEIGELTSLRSLTVFGMNDIPYSLIYCVDLNSVRLLGNQYDEFPEVLNYLPNLQSVDIVVKINEHKLNKSWVDSAVSKVKLCCSQSKFYTHNGNNILNTTMRQGYIPTFLSSIYQSLIDGQISVKNAIENSESIDLYRGMYPEYVKNLQVGDIIYDNAFSSFSSNISIARKFTSLENAYILHLEYSGNALFLGDNDLSYYPHEKEFIIGPQISLSIVSVDKIFVHTYDNQWTSATKLSVVVQNIAPIQTLVTSDKLEKELYSLLDKYKNLVDTKTGRVYTSSYLLEQLDNPIFTTQFSDLFIFIISYLRGDIDQYTQSHPA